MMDLETFSKHLGAFIAFGASRKKTFESSAAVAVRELRNDRAASAAFDTFLEGAGLEVMVNRSGSILRIFPADSSSPFAFDADDFKKAGKSQERELVGFATLCVIASFYPSRSALNQGVRNEVTVEMVISMINSVIEYAEKTVVERGDEVLPKLAERFKVLSDDVGGPHDKGCKMTYVHRALRMLLADDFVKEMDKGRYYLPTEALKMLAVERIDKLKSTLGQILSDYYDQVEMDLDDKEDN